MKTRVWTCTAVGAYAVTCEWHGVSRIGERWPGEKVEIPECCTIKSIGIKLDEEAAIYQRWLKRHGD